MLQLQGNTVELRRRELEALDPANRALQKMVWGLEDAREAMDALSENDFASQIDFNRARALAANRMGSGNVVPFTPPTNYSAPSMPFMPPAASSAPLGSALSPEDQRELLRLLRLIERNTKDTTRGVEDLVEIQDGAA